MSGLRTRTTFIGSNLHLNAPPRHTLHQDNDVEPARIHQPIRNLNGFHLAAHERQRAPWFTHHIVQSPEELIDVPADQSVDVLCGTRDARSMHVINPICLIILGFPGSADATSPLVYIQPANLNDG